MKEEDIIYIKITAYYSNSNELVKRANQDLKNFLRKYIKKRNN